MTAHEYLLQNKAMLAFSSKKIILHKTLPLYWIIVLLGVF